MTDIWAPELHVVNNTWYVYFAADTPPKGNPTHRMYVLQGPASSVDPMAATSTFNLVGQVANLPNQWQIDGTVFTLNHVLYFVYSGWPLNDSSGLTQELFIAKMDDPVTADPNTTPAMISTPTYAWEKYTDPGPGGAVHAINEGPAWLQLDSFQGIVFSAGASWTSDYQLGLLQYVGGDPMQNSSWKKYPQQFLCNNPDGQGPYGPGHCSYTPSVLITDCSSFVLSPDNSQVWVIFHATPNSGDGWNNRKGRCQLVMDKSGMPFSNLYPLPPTTVLPAARLFLQFNRSRFNRS